MAKLKLQGKDLRKIGFPEGPVIGLAIQIFHKHFKYHSVAEATQLLKKVLAQPETYMQDEVLRPVAAALMPAPKDPNNAEIELEKDSISFNIFGREYIEEGALTQMYTATRLPIAVAGALMPDAHQGYGLPIGGVLATENAVIPYGVGVDIGCRMCLSVFPLPESEIDVQHNRLKNILVENTLFGSGQEFSVTHPHEVVESNLFYEIPLLRSLQLKAAKQLGSSGSGNHFVEFGSVEITEYDDALQLPPGKYLGLLSHSGSRGLGATIAQHFTKLAMEKRKLPPTAKHLAWLSLDEEEGHQYWLAMNLAGDYASACHHIIHNRISKALGEKPSVMVENHHNFAWKEVHGNKEVIVHRKGATPAGKNILGIIPGSMTSPGYIVKGKGNEASVSSASHGAGRLMSRTKAKENITWHSLEELLKKHKVTLIGAGLDEAPQAYKDIETVMKAQKHLVDTVGTFYPRIVRMDGK